ncbi:MAG: alkaline phosphatase [Verrucomicrobia bacterium]|nr:MAG: alkaline phosphatase [Verrucomicrobiota bacterium]
MGDSSKGFGNGTQKKLRVSSLSRVMQKQTCIKLMQILKNGMESFHKARSFGRRDLLKTIALGGAAAAIPALHAEPSGGSSERKKVRGIVFMVSDGMSPGVLTLAEAFSQLTRQRSTRWWQLYNQPESARGLMDNAAANSLVTDSAAASSAWGGGERVNNGSINIRPDGSELTPIAKILNDQGTKIGLVTTATITHATPAGFATVSKSRGDEDHIAPQYLNRVDVLLGGGTGHFSADKRLDKRDLFADFSKAGYEVLHDRDALLKSRSEKLLGTFTNGHLPFSLDRQHSEELRAKIPSLEEMAEAALVRLLGSGSPFLLQIEGARIDHAAHLNDIGGLLADQLAFDDALSRVQILLEKHPDVLLVVTSDHGNANPGLNGTGVSYADTNSCFARIARFRASHEKLLEQWNVQKGTKASQITEMIQKQMGINLRKEETAALFEIVADHPVLEWSEQMSKPEGLLGQFLGNHTGIGWTGTSHTSDPTLISAIGPECQRFSGLMKNTEVFTQFRELLG